MKTVSRHFTRYKIIALPARISEGKFVKYSIDFPYFGLDSSQRDYILLTEADLSLYSAGSITVCLANIAIYNMHMQTLICESSLFFQTTDNYNLCRKKLTPPLPNPNPPATRNTMDISFPGAAPSHPALPER